MELKNKYLALVTAIGAEDEVFRETDLNAVESGMMDFSNYVNSIYAMEVLLPIQRFRLDGDALRDYTVKLDSNRKSCHNAAIASMNLLYRLALSLHCEPLHPHLIDGENPASRREAANFCARIVMDVVYDQVTTGIDDTIAVMAEGRFSLKAKA